MSAQPDLARRLARDLDDTFPELVARHQDAIYGVAFRFTRSRDDAADLTQEALVRAYRALESYDSTRIGALRLEPWLWTIAANACRNHARSRSRRPRTSPLDGTEAAAPQDVSLEPAVSPELERAVAALPAPQRLAVLMRHVAGLSVAEISEALQRPEGTVKSDIHRGLAALRSNLDREEAWTSS